MSTAMEFQAQPPAVIQEKIYCYKKLCRVTGCSTADSPAGAACEGVKATHYFTSYIHAPERDVSRIYFYSTLRRVGEIDV